MSDNDFVLIEKNNGIMTITLNRPDKLNALNNDLMEQLKQALLALKYDTEVSVGVLQGAGPSFCSGADIKQFGSAEQQTPAAIRRRGNLSMEVHGLFSKIEKPIISSVRGYAFAGGCGIALAADLVIAADNAKFAYPEIKRGIVPALVLTNLTRLTGRRKAMELVLTGRTVPAQEALDLGLINEVVPEEQLAARTMELAGQLAQFSPEAVAYIKSLFYHVVDMDFQKGLEAGRDVNALMRQSKDFSKGVSEFAKKSTSSKE